MADSASFPAEKATPFMAQFLGVKAAHPDCLVFFRMGDFYELFFEDAEIAAGILDITLTKRGVHQGEPIPMAGVPWHQADGYLQKLIRAGQRVAVVEQMEDPAEARKRGGKSIVRRDVVRIVTAGTLTEDQLLDARAAARLAAFARVGEVAALAWADVSTGAFEVSPVPEARLSEHLAAVGPAEILATETEAPALRADAEALGAQLTLRPAQKADPRHGERRAKALFEVATLDGFGGFTAAELAAIGLLLDYIELTQAGAAPRLSPPVRRPIGAVMAIDAATRASLEIDRSMRGGREGSLLGAVDRTLTAAGGRLLAEHLARPLTDPEAIAARHEAVAFFVERPDLRRLTRKALGAAPELARAVTRLALNRASPRDLAALRDALVAGDEAAARLSSVGEAPPALLAEAAHALSLAAHPAHAALAEALKGALAATLPALTREGGFIAEGWDEALDAARSLRDDSRRVILALQQRYAEETLQPLKIKHNSVLGYHLEATAKQAEALMRPPLNATFIHRQTNVNAVRFTTTELAELDARIARAADEALQRELALFAGFAAEAAAHEHTLRAAAGALATLDVAAGNAEWAVDVDAVRPEVDASTVLIAEGARHPVVEAAVRKAGQGYTPNDHRLDAEGQLGPRLLFVTGPNMAGKSTYLRQTALLAILAQAGCYAPARRLKLGVADRVFSRVGASDDLSRGRSTFMMEMVETAAILNQAGPKAIVILDEIGRGTATYDGLAIAWAAAEHLHDKNRCRAVFATHYHEITALGERLAAAANANLRAREWKGDLIFLHEVAPGPADRSYGIQVAKLAGLPKSAVERAKAVLARLEAGKGAKGPGLGLSLEEALPLFAEAPEAVEPAAESALKAAISEINPDALTPREALDALYRLKALAEKD